MTIQVKEILAGVVVVIAAFAIGRYTGPEKVKIITKTVTIATDTKTDDETTQDHKKVTIIEITKPDGTDTKTTTVVDDTDSQDKSVDTSKTTTDESQTTEITKGSPKILVSALAARNLSNFATPIYGGMVSKSILGPVTIGAFGLSDKTVGLSLGLMF